MPYRVRQRYQANPMALYSPEAGVHIVPDPRGQFADDDPMVLASSWYFIKEGEEEEPAPESVRIADVVEQATRAPGEKRRGPGRPRKPTP